MEVFVTQCKVCKCSKCPGDTNFTCISCQCDLCPQCKDNHVNDLKTINHNIVIYRDKVSLKHSRIQGKSTKHLKRNTISDLYGHPCSCHCTDHRKHTLLYIRDETEKGSGDPQKIIQFITNEVLHNRQVLLSSIQADYDTCHSAFTFSQTEMLKKALILWDRICYVTCGINFKHKSLKERKKLNKHLVCIQSFEHIYEQSTINPVQFLKIKSRVLQLRDSPIFTIHTYHFSINNAINKMDVMESLVDIKTRDGGKRHVQNERLLKLVLPISPDVAGVFSCHHISCMTSERAWVNDSKSLILTNKAGETLHHLENLCHKTYSGLHAVNRKDELFYIDEEYNIIKLSRDMDRAILFIKTTASRRKLKSRFWAQPSTLEQSAIWTPQYVTWSFSTGDRISTWRPQCVCCSPFTGDLLVGMIKEKPESSKVTRYDQSGQMTQTIQYNDKDLELYRGPRFITESNNGDIVVCDDDAVVVTDREGRHRFSYTGHPLGSGLSPSGICTDVLSNIFICDSISKTVHMIDKDGQFLLHLMEPKDEDKPYSLGYNVHTHSLWVGTLYNNTLSIYTHSDQVSLEGNFLYKKTIDK